MIRADKIISWTQISPKRERLHFEKLPDGDYGRAFAEHLESASHPHYTIQALDDETIVDIFDSVCVAENEEEDEFE